MNRRLSRHGAELPQKKIIYLTLLLLLVLIICTGSVLFFRERSHRGILTLYGNVDVRQVDIGFRVAGQVEALKFEEGDFVKEGVLLALLDKTPYDQKVKEAIADAAAVRADLDNAEILLERRMELIGIGGVSQEDLDNAFAKRNELRATLQSAEAAVAVAKDNLSYTEAFAPTNGTILTRIREPGTVVNPADPVYTLSVASPVWIRAYVSEPNLGHVRYGMKARVYTDTKNGKPYYTGKVGFISPVAEFTPKTVQTTQLRTDLVYRLRVYVDNPDDLLKQGMPVTVQLKISDESSSNEPSRERNN